VHIEDINKEKACNVALNKISGDWDEDKLRVVLEDIELSPIDIKLTGFDELELTELEVKEPITVHEDDFNVEEEEDMEVNVKEGDLFKLCNHFLLCGDSTNEANVKKLMGSTKCDLFLTDPPYNVNYTDGHENERKIMNDHWDSDEEAGEKLWKPAFTNARNIANEFCSVYCFMPQGGTHMMMMMMMMMESGWQVKHELIWVKQSLVLGRQDYNYQHEPILYGWGDKHKFYGKGQHATTSVWNFDRPTQSKEHPTMKPLELLGEILLNATVENDVVLDLFGGSGSTLIACEQLNRNCYMMELDPYYCQVIINRWEQYTGQKAEKIN
jgi:DNA modification methylase